MDRRRVLTWLSWILVAVLGSVLLMILLAFFLAGGRLSFSFPPMGSDPVAWWSLATYAVGSVILIAWKALRPGASRSLVGPLALSLAASLAIFVMWVPVYCASTAGHGHPVGLSCESVFGLAFWRFGLADEITAELQFFAQSMLLAPIVTFMTVWLRLRHPPPPERI